MFRAHRICIALMFAWGLACLSAVEPTAVNVSNQNKLNDSDVLAEFDGGVITRKDLDNKISKLPPNSQGRYRTVDGQTQVLDIMAVEEAFMAKAKQLKIDTDPEILDKIEAGTKQFYIQEYYKRNISDSLVVTDADKQRYYDENKQAFYMYPYISISYIQAENEAAANKAARELKAGKPFATVSDTYNINSYAKGLKGLIKNIRLNGNIPGVGNDLDLENYIKNSKADSTVILGPFKTTTGWHVFRTNEYVPGRQKEFQEVLPELDQRTRPGVESRMLDKLTARLKDKYAVVVDTALVAKVDLYNREKDADILDKKLVSSNNPDLNITVSKLLDNFNKLSQQEQLFLSKGEGAKQLLDEEIVRSILYADAKKQNYGQFMTDNADYQQMKRYYILNKAFKQLVVDSVVVDSTETQKYYDEHLSDFTTPAYRSLQVLWFDKEKAAARALKKYKRYVSLNDEKRINELIAEESTKPKLAILDNIYNNGIITGIGPDENFSKLVWDNPVGYISNVFKSTRGDILFFRTTKETPTAVQSFIDVEPRIYGILKNEHQKAQQDKVTQDLFAEFHLVKYPERLTLQLSSEELFNMADNSSKQRNFNDAITFYDQIIKNYANGSDDYRASFMKAFIVAEELKDEQRALQLFREFLAKYPTGDLNESAQFMIDSLEGKDVLKLDE